MMPVSIAEFQANFNKYIALAAAQDIFITDNEKVVAKLSNPNGDRLQVAESLVGILPQTTTWEEAKEERLGEI